MVPLHMAMVASTVANGGQMMKPYVVQETLDHDGNVLASTTPSVWKTPITPETATTMQGLMLGVAERGTASCCIALANGIPVAAKTGTAQLNGPGQPERSNAWIVAYAPADAPRYAVAVMLKGTNAEISEQHRRAPRRSDGQAGPRPGVRRGDGRLMGPDQVRGTVAMAAR